jgi:hypothetical protein
MRHYSSNFTFEYGACFSSGTYSSSDRTQLPHCSGSAAPIGCFTDYSEDECPYSNDSDSEWYIWLNPAQNQTECENSYIGRSGCRVSGASDAKFFWNKTNCICKGGTYENVWR